MRDRAIERQFGADTDADNHETQLVDHTVGQYPAQIVFDDRVEDRESCHQRSDHDQFFGPGETTRKRVDSELGGKCRENDGAGFGGLGIRIRNPAMKKWKRGFYAEGNKQ